MAGRKIRVSKKIFAAFGSGTAVAEAPVASTPKVSPTDIPTGDRPLRCAACFVPREVPTDNRRGCESCGRYATTRYLECEMRNIFIEEY